MPEAHAAMLLDRVHLRHPGSLSACVFDPDGTNVGAVCNGPVERSADSVVLTWESS